MCKPSEASEDDTLDDPYPPRGQTFTQQPQTTQSECSIKAFRFFLIETMIISPRIISLYPRYTGVGLFIFSGIEESSLWRFSP